jgi:pSer/pThr/pTyr-binding forkhead associated (FHA) protein
MTEPQIIIDHLLGSRRGRRQVFPPGATIRFGRHPECEICFDAHRDIDASSRHAEIETEGERFLLRDVGSSNGTFVAGQRVTEVPIQPGEPVVVEFGAGGPQVRVFVGNLEQAPPLPASRSAPLSWVLGVVLLGAAITVATLAVWALWGR